jgi:hypothetical protein
MENQIEEMPFKPEQINSELSLLATKTMEAAVREDFPETFESGKTIKKIDVYAIRKGQWENGPAPQSNAFHAKMKDGKSFIAVKEFDANYLTLDLEKQKRDTNYSEEEYKVLRAKKTNNSITEAENERYKVLSDIWLSDGRKRNILNELKHEWVHEQTDLPPGLYPRAIYFSELFPVFYVPSTSYLELKTITDLVGMALGKKIYGRMIRDAFIAENSYESITNGIKETLGEDFLNMLINYIPEEYKTLHPDSEIEWRSFEDIFNKLASYINANSIVTERDMEILRIKMRMGVNLTEEMLAKITGKAE